jgi:catalase-peroxidase
MIDLNRASYVEIAAAGVGPVADLHALMTDSQDWWPADFGHYGGLFIRLAWHSAGTYRTSDGRGGAGGGQQRFAPLNSWPDNANLDKARRLLWPIKQKYGATCRGPTSMSWSATSRWSRWASRPSASPAAAPTPGSRRSSTGAPKARGWATSATAANASCTSLGAVQMGLIYVNPEGPNGNPDPLGSAHDIRDTFARMAMNDEETVALIAGGHTFGKTHGAGDPSFVGPEPEGGEIHDQGLGWRSKHGTGCRGRRHHRRPGSHLEPDSDEVEQPLLREPLQVRVGADQEPRPARSSGRPRTRRPTSRPLRRRQEARADHADLGPRPAVRPRIREDLAPVHENPDQFADAFARAWFKLTHRDMGPIGRYLGPLGPQGDADLAGPDPGRRPPAGRRRGHRGPEGQDPGLGPDGLGAGVDRLGLGLDLPRV